ncbi:RTA1 like protein [Aspergillus parasiticus SU-1]|uniref:RTA1 like protein-domain-containing protein n=3 Tax=Aspergillus subgen. Circumdati TaxID=2720871 RepID=A0A5N6D2X6_ASPPA|nr:RTA1 like protein-domain-containing protein [Aspergillus parasiticus]KAE8306710.1 RTA1 like protein-domain-containing protein [Aspergillus transmontanensis]KJK64952.1 RTA1 like protein [Aspergillus parasiticus SU-1]
MSADQEFEYKKWLSTSCHPIIDGMDTAYGYQPSLAAGIVFLVLFGLSMIVHTIQFTWKRTWWCAVFSIGCLTEVLGWAGRTWSSECPYNMTAFLMQISTLIIAPTFFTAGIYVLLGRFIQILGRDSSILSPKMYLWIFCTCDVISLVIQAIGGGIASAETNKEDGDTAPGTHIMVAGIVFQLFSITVFVACAADFVRRVLRRRLLQNMSGSFTPLFAAMVFSVLCIYVRSIYRTIELSQGWSGYLITREKYFIALDGAMMVAAVGVFNIFHPGWLMPSTKAMQYDREIMSEDGYGHTTELR